MKLEANRRLRGAGLTDPIGLKIAVDERTNSLVFQPDDDQQSREFEQTFVLLDTETPSPSVTGHGVSISVPALGPTPLTFDERRVEDLLNPNLKWDGFQPSGLTTGVGVVAKDSTHRIVSSATEMQGQLKDPHNSQLPFQLKTAVESDPSTQVRCVAIQLLSSRELAYTIEAQSVELQPLLMKTLEADSSTDVRCAALGALMAMDNDSEWVHKTLIQWARCKERLQVEHALSLMLRNHEVGDRPQSIDELIELLSDPEWGTTLEVKQNNYRWARQYAIANLGEYAAHAHRALPTLEAELARKNKDTLSFTTEAIDSVRGYCPDRPIDQLQGQREFVSVNGPSSSAPFFDFPLHPGGVYPAVGREIRTASPERPPSIINVSGTQLKLGGRVLAEISHQRQNLEIVMLLDPDGKKRHCHGGYNFKGGPSPEYKPNVAPAPEVLIVEVSESNDDPSATLATKQIYALTRSSVSPRR